MEHLVLGLPVRSRLRRGAVPTIGVPVNVQPVTKMLVEDAKRSLLKVAHAKMLTGQQKVAASGVGDNGDADATDGNKQQHQKQQHHDPTDKRQHHQQHHHHHHQQHHRATNKNGTNHRASQEQKMAGIDVLLALGLKPAPRDDDDDDDDGNSGGGKKLEQLEALTS
ncbi:hypothetical protein HZH66_005347 [Vespula vulgaris]|uniref:Uncharacterized protein n=1 Tax=Vespula vulgaris TaxID=7454 RepID=A0A834NAR2_VESVU|nr:hypothetical protein HZH66_005347 [Vespula vulgaris]